MNILACPTQPLTSAVIACALGVSIADIAAPTRRSARASLARHAAIYLAHIAFGATFSALGRAFDRDPSSARHACARIETARDAAGFDCLMNHLERASRFFADALGQQCLQVADPYGSQQAPVPPCKPGEVSMTHTSKPAIKHAASARLDADSRRLLQALTGHGACGYEDDSGAQPRIAISAARNGVSIRVGTNTPAAAMRLCAEDLAVWQSPSAGAMRRLLITEAGRAHAARDAAPDGLDAFTAQHNPVLRRPADTTPDAAIVHCNQAESPLAWLATRRDRDGKAMIDAAALEAGERLRRDLTFAQILPRVTANWDANAAIRGSLTQGGHVSAMAIDARRRVEQAVLAVGADFADILIDVCGFLKGLELVESERGWPRRSAKVVLVLALNQLRRHYGIANEAVGPRHKGAPLHWGTQDYRPNIGGAG